MPTWDLINDLKSQHPSYQFTFCMGTDLLSSFRSWDSGDKLAEDIDFIILKRPKYDVTDDLFPKKYRFLETIIEGSSTKIRNRIAEQIETMNKFNLGINGLTTTSVIKYIIENNLYSVENR